MSLFLQVFVFCNFLPSWRAGKLQPMLLHFFYNRNNGNALQHVSAWQIFFTVGISCHDIAKLTADGMIVLVMCDKHHFVAIFL